MKDINAAEHFIVFDLEWNQCPQGKSKEQPELPFEIIDIGAVKLNRNLETVDHFHCFVRPQVYKSLHYRTREVIGIHAKELRSGSSFEDAAKAFLAFAGPAPLYCTWSDQDLMELQRNLAFYGMLDLLPGPILFADVQKLFALTFEERQKRRSLEFAAEYLGIKEDREYHRAYDDAYYTAEVLKNIPPACIFGNFSVDTFQCPKTKSEEIRLLFPDREKYIFRTFPEEARKEILRDREITALHCPVCGHNVKRALNWTSSGRRHYIAVGVCGDHGPVVGRLRLRTTFEGDISPERVTRLAEDDEAVRYVAKYR